MSASRSWVTVGCLAVSGVACEIEDQAERVDDELGLQGRAGRSEIVVVEADTASATDIASADSALLIIYEPEGEFTVQIGLYENAQIAGKIVSELSSAGYPAYAIANPGSKGVRVRIGYFGSRGEAVRFGRLFKEDRGLDYWIDRRSKESY
jgi:hypothetical protein